MPALPALTSLALAAAVFALPEAPPDPAAPGAASGASCDFTIRARNDSGTDVWLMLYDSQTQRPNSLLGWERLKIQNHRVAPGVRITRTYRAPGGCNHTRPWRFVMKRGTDFYTHRHTTGTASTVIDLGNVARHF